MNINRMDRYRYVCNLMKCYEYLYLGCIAVKIVTIVCSFRFINDIRLQVLFIVIVWIGVEILTYPTNEYVTLRRRVRMEVSKLDEQSTEDYIYKVIEILNSRTGLSKFGLGVAQIAGETTARWLGLITIKDSVFELHKEIALYTVYDMFRKKFDSINWNIDNFIKSVNWASENPGKHEELRRMLNGDFV